MKSGNLVKAEQYACRGQMLGIVIQCNRKTAQYEIQTLNILWANGSYEDYIDPRWVDVIQ